MSRRKCLYIVAVAICGLLAAALLFKRAQSRNADAITARGGVTVAIPVLETPFFAQIDERWRNEEIGGSGEKLKDVGCTLCCLAMAIDRFGIHTTPKELNSALKTADAFTQRGLLKWDAVPRACSNEISIDYSVPLAHTSIDTALQRGEPVLARVLLYGVASHWILIVGKEADDYLIHDPLIRDASPRKLSTYHSDIHAIRVVTAAPKHR